MTRSHKHNKKREGNKTIVKSVIAIEQLNRHLSNWFYRKYHNSLLTQQYMTQRLQSVGLL